MSRRKDVFKCDVCLRQKKYSQKKKCFKGLCKACYNKIIDRCIELFKAGITPTLIHEKIYNEFAYGISVNIIRDHLKKLGLKAWSLSERAKQWHKDNPELSLKRSRKGLEAYRNSAQYKKEHLTYQEKKSIRKIAEIENKTGKSIKACLTELYWDKKMSTAKIGKLFGLTQTTIAKWMHRYGVDLRSAKEARKMPEAKKRIVYGLIHNAIISNRIGSRIMDFIENHHQHPMFFKKLPNIYLKRLINEHGCLFLKRYLKPSFGLIRLVGCDYYDLATKKELTKLVKCGDEKASEKILTRFTNLNNLTDEKLFKIIDKYSNLQLKKTITGVIFQRNMKIVYRISTVAVKQCVSFELNDLIQEGMIALIKAIKNYNKNVKSIFKRYAWKVVVNSLHRQINNLDSIIRIPCSDYKRKEELLYAILKKELDYIKKTVMSAENEYLRNNFDFFYEVLKETSLDDREKDIFISNIKYKISTSDLAAKYRISHQAISQIIRKIIKRIIREIGRKELRYLLLG